MKLLIFIGLTPLILMLNSAEAAGVDRAKSEIIWSGQKVVGSAHSGTLGLKSAKVQYRKNRPVSARVVVDMTTLKNTDLKDPQYQKKLVQHLSSKDFFDVDEHKTATLDVTKITKKNESRYELAGKLTIKGKTMSTSFAADIIKRDAKQEVVVARLTFDRTKFGIRYGSGSFFENLGDNMIADDVQLTVKLVINR